MKRISTLPVVAALLGLTIASSHAQTIQVDQSKLDQLLQRLNQDEERIKQLEARLLESKPAGTISTAAPAPAPAPNDPSDPPAAALAGMLTAMPLSSADHDHMMEIPGGPSLRFRGYTDLNFGVGQDSNHLIFPLGARSTSSFRMGEFDLFMSSKLSEHLSFVSELVLGADSSNAWGVDLERIQLTYRASPFFEISGGRYHTAIGYYNTAFHHGTWFQAATGRPFMYYFEDAGGLLPTHNVGVTATGLVPGTDKLGLHWVAEIGNGRSVNHDAYQVQNFNSDRNSKSTNFAAYIRPEWMQGLQVGGSFYRDRLYPVTKAGRVNQTASSAYIVYTNSKWELLNEAVLLRNRSQLTGQTFSTPLMYTQVAHRFGAWQPFTRYQYVKAAKNDPVNVFEGRYQGPSFGVRYNLSEYAALKFQYNRLLQTGVKAQNGLETQIAFAF